jgi:hypothetical protein
MLIEILFLVHSSTNLMVKRAHETLIGGILVVNTHNIKKVYKPMIMKKITAPVILNGVQ